MRLPLAFAVILFVVCDCVLVAADAAAKADLAKQLSNPVASLISVPLQLNYDETYGEDGERWTLNLQPVYPFTLNENWNLISRTILPIISQDGVVGDDHQAGLGDTVQSFFASPVAPTDSGWIWGVGPVLLLPTATKDELGNEQWGIGPTAVFLRQDGSMTYGGLLNHIVSVAGDDERADINATFLQPFCSYSLPSATTFAANFEATRDWETREWNIPLNVMVSQVVKVGDQLLSVQGGVRYWLDTPSGGPEWGWRMNVTFLFPR